MPHIEHTTNKALPSDTSELTVAHNNVLPCKSCTLTIFPISSEEKTFSASISIICTHFSIVFNSF